ncbi:F-box only protein 42-like [Saccostrea cucullata]|uniref:F-box only protein 42-like n=1 Tax=Saccostrea cuccullata TaxID=36930 RepID=UPI002ED50A2E
MALSTKPSQKGTMSSAQGPLQITDLPEEILEFILLHLSPYRDLKCAMLVNRQWHRLVQGVIRQMYQSFYSGIVEGQLEWTGITPEVGSNITERYSHCACYYDKSMYIFGGCTSTNTTFNDLWRFDLKERQWIRPLAIGTYPSPKACASLVVYKDSLVLFGGWSHPTPYPLHQAARFFSELHIYKPEQNRWYHLNTMSPVSPAPTAGHSASIVGDRMVVFGGSHVPGTGNNEVWEFNFIDMTWQRKHTGNKRPNPRYGQTQVTLDDTHILVVGGCGGPNQIFNDLWLLCLDTDPWSWEEVIINQSEFSAPQLWCHPACKVNDKMIVLSKPSKPLRPPSSDPRRPANYAYRNNKIWVPPHESPREAAGPQSSVSRQAGPTFKRPVSESDDSSSADDEENSGQRSDRSHLEFKHPGDVVRGRGPSPRRSPVSPSRLQSYSYVTDPDTSGPSMQAFSTSDARPGVLGGRQNAVKNREKQLEALRKFEERLRESLARPPGSQGQNQPTNDNVRKTRLRELRTPIHLHVLDISNIVQSRTASWQPVKENLSLEAPEETIFYTLVEGRGELVMFGGIQRDIQSMQRGMDVKSHVVSNNLYMLSPSRMSL